MKWKGMTLVELILVITMLGILLGLTVMVLDPRKQIAKVDDAARMRDIQQIKTGLDTYYNDHDCYPTTLPFGQMWQENSTVYMRKVPQDVSCVGNANCYVYKYTGSCPQWNVVFTKLSIKPTTSQCSLSQLQTCTPTDYDPSWACIVSGNIDSAGCAHISSSSLSNGSDSSGETGNSENGNGSIPTPTPGQQVCSKDYVCSNGTCNHTTTNMGEYCSSDCSGQCAGR